MLDGKHHYPGHQPQPPLKLRLDIEIGGSITTPTDALAAIAESIALYGTEHNGTLTPFIQQPGYQPGADITDESGHKVGEWRVS